MTFNPDTLYQPKDLPLNERDRAIVATYPPPRAWAVQTGLKRALGGCWQWYGVRPDGLTHPWGALMDLSI